MQNGFEGCFPQKIIPHTLSRFALSYQASSSRFLVIAEHYKCGRATFQDTTQQAVEYIEWSGRMFVQLYLEDTIRKSDLNLGIMAEGQGQRGFAETASAAQRGSNCCGLAALLVESACG